jgi:hypothetical protein
MSSPVRFTRFSDLNPGKEQLFSSLRDQPANDQPNPGCVFHFRHRTPEIDRSFPRKTKEIYESTGIQFQPLRGVAIAV